MSTSSESPNVFNVGENVTIDQLYIAALNATVIMNGQTIVNDNVAKPLPNFTKNQSTLDIWYSFYDGTDTKAVIATFALSGNTVSIYQSGARNQSGNALTNGGTWNTVTDDYGVILFRIII